MITVSKVLASASSKDLVRLEASSSDGSGASGPVVHTQAEAFCLTPLRISAALRLQALMPAAGGSERLRRLPVGVLLRGRRLG